MFSSPREKVWDCRLEYALYYQSISSFAHPLKFTKSGKRRYYKAQVPTRYTLQPRQNILLKASLVIF